MAAGVPVISSNAGGLPEVNLEGETGYMVDVGDVATMSKRAVELLSDENKLAKVQNKSGCTCAVIRYRYHSAAVRSVVQPVLAKY